MEPRQFAFASAAHACEGLLVDQKPSHRLLIHRAIKKKNGGKFPVIKAPAKKAEAKIKAPRFYAAEDTPKPFAR